jgi:hypothetical protein
MEDINMRINNLKAKNLFFYAIIIFSAGVIFQVIGFIVNLSVEKRHLTSH